jgi:serine/threonine-protein kinase 24/25/MST4
MEYCGGGSCESLAKPGTIPEDYIAILMREVLFGLYYIHSENKIHRDIKGSSNKVMLLTK